MIYVIVFIAFILTWFFIEITLFYTNKNDYFINSKSQITYIKFIWFLRVVALFLIFIALFYMYYFENINFEEALQYCLGLVK